MKRPFSYLHRPLALAALLAIQCAYFIYFLNRFRYLPGTDSYFYALQTQSLLESGHLKVPESPVVYYLIATLCRAGLSIEASFKILLSAIFILYSAGLWGLMARLRGSTWPLCLLLIVISIPVIAFHVVEFPRLSLGLATVPIWFLLLAGVKRAHTWMLMTLLVACSFVHIAIPFLGLAFALGVAMSRAGAYANRIRLFSAKYVLSFLSGLIVVAAMIVRMWPDLGLRIVALRLRPPGIAEFFGQQTDVPPDLKIVVSLVWLLVLILAALNFRSLSWKWWPVTFGALGIPILTNDDPSLLGLSGRLAVLVVFVAIPLTVILLGEVSEATPSILQSSRAKWILTLTAIFLAAIVPLRMGEYRSLLGGYEYDAFEKVVADLRNERIPMLIASRGLDFYYSYRLRRDAFHFDPEPGWKRSDIWRVARRITPEEFAYYSPPTCFWGVTGRTIRDTDYLLVREDCWEQLRANVNAKDNPDLYVELWEDSENPSGARPAFLRERHRETPKDEFSAQRSR